MRRCSCTPWPAGLARAACAGVGAQELGAVLDRLIAAPPVHFRTVFVLRAVEGMSTAEVAQVLELSEDNVKARLSRARASLADKLTREIRKAAVDAWRFDAVRCDAVAKGVMREFRRGRREAQDPSDRRGRLPGQIPALCGPSVVRAAAVQRHPQAFQRRARAQKKK
jgi:hypothetical protein